MNKLDMESKNIVNENIEKISELFPNVIVESNTGKTIDFDLLRQELSNDIVEGVKEKYQLTWPGKKEAIVHSNIPSKSTLRPVKEKSVDFDNTQNIYIEGDNLEVLKILQESYLNKIKCIYIDPPYNTGNDFIYNDKFQKNIYEELLESGQVDEEGNRMVTNNQSNGRFHSDWLSMMYPRLKLARNLLTDDGVIFISIDRNEQANLIQICDEIFGRANYIDTIVWDKKISAKGVPPKNMMVNVHEYIVSYQKNGKFKFVGEKRDEKRDGFKNPDNDPRGPWRESNIKSTTKSAENAFTIINPDTGKEYTNTWAFSKDSLERMIKEKRILWKESLPKQKEFMNELSNENKAIKSSWGVYDAQSTTMFLKSLIPEIKFDNPKPINLMKYLVNVSTKNNDIILDFFSGSATSAQAILEINALNSEDRKFIMVQLPEKCEENSEAYKNGYKTICDIREERIRRAGAKIKEETNADIDYGFRVYKIDSTNMKDIYYTSNDLEQRDLLKFESNIKEDRTSDDLLTQVILDLGLTLDLSIEERIIGKNKVYYVAGNLLAACFDDNIDIDIVDKICECEPYKVVFKDNAFNTDNDKINLEERFKKLLPQRANDSGFINIL